jgi:hypothetical protein
VGHRHSFSVAAGDNIGGTPLLSGLFHDEPTIESLNKMGVDVSGVGNHEFDEGWRELLRMQRGGCHPVDGCQDGDPFTGELSDPNANCLAPRQVLVEASRVCYGCSLGGLLLSCPEGDPNFHSCLCSHRIDSLAFTQLAKCFLRSTVDDLSCFSFAKRNDFVKRDDYEPPAGMVANMKRDLFAVCIHRTWNLGIYCVGD